MQIARIVVGLALLAGTACSDQGLSKEEFIERADAVCAEAEEQTKDLQPPRSPEELAEFTDEAQRITGELLSDLRELEPPEEGRETIESLLATIEEALGYLPQIRDAALERQAQRIQELGSSLQQASSKANEIAQGYGLQTCGRTQTAPT